MEKFSNLSTSAKAGMGAGGLGILGVGAAVGMGKWIFLLVLVLVLALVLGGYLAWGAWKRRQRAARLGGELQQHTTASPRGISDPGQRARLDDLRKKFEQGVHEYRSRGKELYTLPWFVIVGEPGSGKTEAVRHSNVGFPPGMQDEFQGVGGTINMNWWFTNQAVLLDTAGRLMFEEVKPGETSEWKEFLNLLKKNRPNCPINGLLLVIPADTLIRDSADDIARKAGRIAQQLDVIQRVLDVRFPVCVTITKCDKINGFREFFDGLTDPQLQHQMVGWSNPDPLDAPFRPELVDQHLESVAGRLRRRRLGLLRDPVPENAAGRRSDEVDALYALPHSLSLLAPRLRRYLESIFIAGEWSAKPLFLRGIYFTSSMREGAALDEELAKVIGMPVDELPEGKVWERERAYFLRDLFLEKIFREKGLVTRATNTSQMVRRHQIILFSAAAVAVAVFVGLAALGMNSLSRNVTDKSTSWRTVGEVGWRGKTWGQSIIPVGSDGRYEYRATNLVSVEGQKLSLGEFHVSLRNRAEERISESWLYFGLASAYNQKSLEAQRIVFETGVIKPLIEASRQKMSGGRAGDTNSQKYLPEALATLIRLEGDVFNRGKAVGPLPLSPQSAERFLRPLLNFVTGRETPSDTNLQGLVVAMSRTFSGGDPATLWPPAWCSGFVGPEASLTNNPGVRLGLEFLVKAANEATQVQEGGWQQTAPLREALRRFKQSEEALFQAAREASGTEFNRHFQELAVAREALQKQWAAGPQVSLASAYRQYRADLSAGVTASLNIVRAALDEQTNQTAPFFFEARRQVVSAGTQLDALVQRLYPEGETNVLRELDEAYLGKPGFAERWVLYEKSVSAKPARAFGEATLLGTSGELLQKFLSNDLARVRGEASAYAGPLKPNATTVCTYALAAAESRARREFFDAYKKEAEMKVRNELKFPLVRNPDSSMTLGKLNEVATEVTYVRQDLATAVFRDWPFKDDAGWKGFCALVTNVSRVVDAVLDGKGGTRNCTLSLMKVDREDPRENWRRLGVFFNIALAPVGEKGKVEQTDRPSQDVTLNTVPLDKPLQVQVFRNLQDATGLQLPASGDWGALWLLHRPKSVKVSPTEWVVEWPLQKQDFDGVVRLRLKFESPVPDPSAWPSL